MVIPKISKMMAVDFSCIAKAKSQMHHICDHGDFYIAHHCPVNAGILKPL